MEFTSILYYVAPLIGLVCCLIGTGAVLRPQAMSKKFGIAVSGSALPYVIATGIRDVFMGIAVLILFYQQNKLALGAVCFCLGIVAISDFLVVRKHGDSKTSLVHLAGAILAIGYGFWLIS